MKVNVHTPKEQVIDMRHAVRFAGGPEPRPGMRSGHIPGSFSFPFMTMFDGKQQWKSLDKIRQQLVGISVDFHLPIVSMCGSAMTATILDFALDLLDHPSHAVYDGSWAEWGVDTLYTGENSLSERPVVTSI